MGWFSWDGGSSSNTTEQRYADAWTFLNTGQLSTSLGGTRCSSSTQCASGYACVGGQCTQITQSSGQASSGPCGTGPGSGGGRPGSGTGGCSTSASTSSRSGSGSNGGCTTSTCGSGNGGAAGGGSYVDSDCCGNRCCRFSANPGGSTPIVNCYCGDCPGQNGERCGAGYAACAPGLTCVNGYCTDASACNSFCDAYYKSNGSYAPGCSEDNVCSECEACDNNGRCSATAPDVPCHCNPGSLENCYKCNPDGTSEYDPDNCMDCCTIENYDCPQCSLLASATVCVPRGQSGLSVCNLAQQAAFDKCAKDCPSPPPGSNEPTGRCAGECEQRTVCGPGTCDNADNPHCPDNKSCTTTGCIEANGEACYLFYECDVSNVPEDCKACDCNCHDDCPECYVCNELGSCVPDPTCCVTPTGSVTGCLEASTGYLQLGYEDNNGSFQVPGGRQLQSIQDVYNDGKTCPAGNTSWAWNTTQTNGTPYNVTNICIASGYKLESRLSPGGVCRTATEDKRTPRCYNSSTGTPGSCCNGFACRADGTCANKVTITVLPRLKTYSVTCACCCACEGRPNDCCYTPCGTEMTGAQTFTITLPNANCRPFAEWSQRTTTTTPSGGTWACASGKTGYGGFLQVGYYKEDGTRQQIGSTTTFPSTYYETGLGCTVYHYYEPPEATIGAPF